MGAAILIFLIFTAATYVACYLAFWGPEKKAAEDRARRFRGLRAERVQQEAVSLLKQRSLSSVGFLDQIYSRLRLMRQLQKTLEQAALPWAAGAVLSACLLLAAGCFLITFLLNLVPMLLLQVLLALGVGLLPVAYVSWKRNQRMTQVEEALPEAIDLFTRAMRAGHNIHSGLDVLSKESPEPLAGEFRKVVEELNLGATVERSLHNLGDRVPLLDVRFLTTGIILQRETGANLVSVLENMSVVIRERLQLRAKLRAHTAQQRFSAALLCGLPVFTLLVFAFIRYDYVSVLWTTDQGAKFFSYAVVSELVGIFVIKRISTIRM